MVRVRDEDCVDCQAKDDDTAGCGKHGGHTHAAPGEIREGELHWQDGWFFTRMFDGTVKIRLASGCQNATAMIPAEHWDAIHAHVRGEN